jgi:hypothetical protein
MHRASFRGPIPFAAFAAFVALGALGGCAKAKSNETPAPIASASAAAPTEGGVAPQSAGSNLLCTDGLHKRGDHWKVACNVCRCGADGAILCSEFLCTTPVRDASRTD